MYQTLLDLGKKWRADSVDLGDGMDEEYGFRLKRRLRADWKGSYEVKTLGTSGMQSLFATGGTEAR